MAEDRPPGVLTKGDREYLLGEKSYKSKEAESNKKRAIRRRIQNGILDFGLIEKHLENSEREKIFKQGKSLQGNDQEYFSGAIESFLAWLYCGLYESGFYSKAFFEEGIRTAEMELSSFETPHDVKPEVHISVGPHAITEVEHAIEMLDKKEPITYNQIFRLIQLDTEMEFDDVETIKVISNYDTVDVELGTVEKMFNERFGSDVELELVDIKG